MIKRVVAAAVLSFMFLGAHASCPDILDFETNKLHAQAISSTSVNRLAKKWYWW